MRLRTIKSRTIFRWGLLNFPPILREWSSGIFGRIVIATTNHVNNLCVIWNASIIVAVCCCFVKRIFWVSVPSCGSGKNASLLGVVLSRSRHLPNALLIECAGETHLKLFPCCRIFVNAMDNGQKKIQTSKTKDTVNGDVREIGIVWHTSYCS